MCGLSLEDNYRVTDNSYFIRPNHVKMLFFGEDLQG
jgi:hypothetical protein